MLDVANERDEVRGAEGVRHDTEAEFPRRLQRDG